MKTLYYKTIIVLLTLLSSFNISAQNYNQFTKNVGWCMVESFSLGYWPIAQKHTGDTLFNSVNYKKFTRDVNKTTLIREDSIQQKVWAIMPDSTAETLLYDFNLVVGNQVDLAYVGYYTVTYQVDSVDSVTTPLGIRKRINLSTTDTLFDPELIWIEGVGSTYGPIYLLDPTFEIPLAVAYIRHHLISSYQSMGIQSYSGTNPFGSLDGTVCSSFTSLEEKSVKDNITIYPNPTIGSINIAFEETKSIINLRITNALGQVVLTESYHSTNHINLELKMPRGIYFLQLESDGELITRKIIKE